MDIQVFTWNTFGKPNDIKNSHLNGKCSIGKSIVCIQEGGVPHPIAPNTPQPHNLRPRQNWHIHAGDTFATKNERCTNYILVSQSAQTSITNLADVSIVDGRGTPLLQGGVAARAPEAISFTIDGKTILVISFHATASGASIGDIGKLLEAINKNHTKYDMIIIGGDFNSTPEEVAKKVIEQKRRNEVKMHIYEDEMDIDEVDNQPIHYLRSQNKDPINHIYKNIRIIHGGLENYTHNENKVYDFFVVMSKGSPDDLKNAKATVINGGGSDHKMVKLEI